MTWKKEEEDGAMCRFIKATANFMNKDCQRRYYVCHRSGRFVSKSRNIRNLKVQGSCKIGQKCTSFINVKINSSGLNWCDIRMLCNVHL